MKRIYFCFFVLAFILSSCDKNETKPNDTVLLKIEEISSEITDGLSSYDRNEFESWQVGSIFHYRNEYVTEIGDGYLSMTLLPYTEFINEENKEKCSVIIHETVFAGEKPNIYVFKDLSFDEVGNIYGSINLELVMLTSQNEKGVIFNNNFYTLR